MPKKGVPSSVRNNQRLEEILTSGSFNKELQEGARAYFRTQAKKRAYLEYMPIGGLETQLPLIRERFGLPERMEARSYLPLKHISHDSPLRPQSIQEILDWREKSERQREIFLRKLSLTELKKFDFAVKWIAASHGLDFTWYSSIADMIINGYYLAPYYNLVVRTRKDEEALVLELTGTTSLEDIRYAQETIKRLQKVVFGATKRSRYSEKRINLAEFIRTSEETIGQIEEYYETTIDKTVFRRKTLEDAVAFLEGEGKIKALYSKKRRLFKQKIRTGMSRKKKLVKPTN